MLNISLVLILVKLLLVTFPVNLGQVGYFQLDKTSAPIALQKLDQNG